MGLGFHARPNCLRRSPKANDDRMLLKAGKVLRVDDEAAARGDNGPIPQGQFLDEMPLLFPKRLFAAGREDLGDGFSAPRLDDGVRVQKCKPELLGHEPSHR